MQKARPKRKVQSDQSNNVNRSKYKCSYAIQKFYDNCVRLVKTAMVSLRIREKCYKYFIGHYNRTEHVSVHNLPDAESS